MIKLPKKFKWGSKIFGISIALLFMLNSTEASIRKDLPVSKVSDEFPETYQLYIDKLKERYPTATFKAVYTGLDWNLVLKHESYEVKKGISLVPSSYSTVWKKDGKNIYMDGNFVVASKSAVAYVLDPRNSLYEKTVFQFEGLSYNPNITTDVIEKVMSSSPMIGSYSNKYKNAGQWIEMDMSYADIIHKVGEEQGVSSVYIASRLIQETSGDIVNNGSINGSNVTYPGVYNFFNIGATPNADGTGAVLNGLKYAKSQGWTNPYFAISGGVSEIKNSYIKYGQDTVYFQKFDVNNPYGNASALMAYQYQTNIMAPTSESLISYRAYSKLDMLDAAFTFYIPVYNNMPQDPTPYPAGDTAKFEVDNTKVYLDDTTDSGKEIFNIRSSANAELDNIIYTITETSEDANERTILTRTQKGNGYDWDYVEVKIDGKTVKGYVWKDYVQTYQYTKVESVSLDKTEITIEEDETLKLVATVMPEGARFKEIIWASSHNNIVTVENGEIKGVGVGTATITAATEDQGKIAVCQVTVNEKPYDMTLDKDAYTVEAGCQITPTVTLKKVEQYTLTVADENIAKVIDNKTIEGLAEGETTIEVRAVGVELVKTAKLTVTPKEYLIITDKEEYTVEVESTTTPTVTLKNIQGYTLEIVDTTIALLEDKTIKGIKAGETTLRILGIGTEMVKEVKLIVSPKEQKITLDKQEYIIRIGETVTPEITLKNIEGYTLEVLDTTIATVEDKTVKGVVAGETILRVLGIDTEIVKEVKLTVLPNESYTLDESIKLDVETKQISGISEATKVSDVKSKIKIEGLNVKFKDINNNELTDESLIGTGTIIAFLREDNTEYDKLTVVVYGDVNGDGYIFANDYVLIKNYIMGEGDLTSIGKTAADVSRDTYVYANDYVLIKNYIMGEGSITQ